MSASECIILIGLVRRAFGHRVLEWPHVDVLDSTLISFGILGLVLICHPPHLTNGFWFIAVRLSISYRQRVTLQPRASSSHPQSKVECTCHIIAGTLHDTN